MSNFRSMDLKDNSVPRSPKPREERQIRETARCPNCGSLAIYVDPIRGERVCDNCGLVLDEGMVDQGPDWTTFEGDDRIRAGPPPAVMAPGCCCASSGRCAAAPTCSESSRTGACTSSR